MITEQIKLSEIDLQLFIHHDCFVLFLLAFFVCFQMNILITFVLEASILSSTLLRFDNVCNYRAHSLNTKICEQAEMVQGSKNQDIKNRVLR